MAKRNLKKDDNVIIINKANKYYNLEGVVECDDFGCNKPIVRVFLTKLNINYTFYEDELELI